MAPGSGESGGEMGLAALWKGLERRAEKQASVFPLPEPSESQCRFLGASLDLWSQIWREAMGRQQGENH